MKYLSYWYPLPQLVLRSDPNKARRRAQVKEGKDAAAPAAAPLTKAEIKDINQRWEDNEVTSNLYNLIINRELETLSAMFENQPALAHVRSKDGRGPMWWAQEHGRSYVVELLKSHGVSDKLKDKDGKFVMLEWHHVQLTLFSNIFSLVVPYLLGMTPLDLVDDEF